MVLRKLELEPYGSNCYILGSDSTGEGLVIDPGGAAEHIISHVLIKSDDVIPGNMYFTTTRLHQELAGGTFVDVIIDEAHDSLSLHPFKGNVNLDKLQKLIERELPEKAQQ